MIRSCDGVCRWHEDGTRLQNNMSTNIRSRYSKIKQEDWDRIFKKGKTNDADKRVGEKTEAQLPGNVTESPPRNN